MPENQPYPGESQQQFIARMQSPQNQIMANPAENPGNAAGGNTGPGQPGGDPQTIAQMIAVLQANKGKGNAPPQQPQQPQILPEKPDMQMLSRFAPRIGQQVPALRGRGMMVIGSQAAQMKYAHAMYMRQRQMQIQQMQQKKAQEEMRRMQQQQQRAAQPNPSWQGGQGINHPGMPNPGQGLV